MKNIQEKQIKKNISNEINLLVKNLENFSDKLPKIMSGTKSLIEHNKKFDQDSIEQNIYEISFNEKNITLVQNFITNLINKIKNTKEEDKDKLITEIFTDKKIPLKDIIDLTDSTIQKLITEKLTSKLDELSDIYYVGQNLKELQDIFFKDFKDNNGLSDENIHILSKTILEKLNNIKNLQKNTKFSKEKIEKEIKDIKDNTIKYLKEDNTDLLEGDLQKKLEYIQDLDKKIEDNNKQLQDKIFSIIKDYQEIVIDHIIEKSGNKALFAPEILELLNNGGEFKIINEIINPENIKTIINSALLKNIGAQFTSSLLEKSKHKYESIDNTKELKAILEKIAGTKKDDTQLKSTDSSNTLSNDSENIVADYTLNGFITYLSGKHISYTELQKHVFGLIKEDKLSPDWTLKIKAAEETAPKNRSDEENLIVALNKLKINDKSMNLIYHIQDKVNNFLKTKKTTQEEKKDNSLDTQLIKSTIGEVQKYISDIISPVTNEEKEQFDQAIKKFLDYISKNSNDTKLVPDILYDNFKTQIEKHNGLTPYQLPISELINIVYNEPKIADEFIKINDIVNHKEKEPKFIRTIKSIAALKKAESPVTNLVKIITDDNLTKSIDEVKNILLPQSKINEIFNIIDNDSINLINKKLKQNTSIKLPKSNEKNKDETTLLYILRKQIKEVRKEGNELDISKLLSLSENNNILDKIVEKVFDKLVNNTNLMKVWSYIPHKVPHKPGDKTAFTNFKDYINTCLDNEYLEYFNKIKGKKTLFIKVENRSGFYNKLLEHIHTTASNNKECEFKNIENLDLYKEVALEAELQSDLQQKLPLVKNVINKMLNNDNIKIADIINSVMSDLNFGVLVENTPLAKSTITSIVTSIAQKYFPENIEIPLGSVIKSGVAVLNNYEKIINLNNELQILTEQQILQEKNNERAKNTSISKVKLLDDRKKHYDDITKELNELEAAEKEFVNKTSDYKNSENNVTRDQVKDVANKFTEEYTKFWDLYVDDNFKENNPLIEQLKSANITSLNSLIKNITGLKNRYKLLQDITEKPLLDEKEQLSNDKEKLSDTVRSELEENNKLEKTIKELESEKEYLTTKQNIDELKKDINQRTTVANHNNNKKKSTYKQNDIDEIQKEIDARKVYNFKHVLIPVKDRNVAGLKKELEKFSNISSNFTIDIKNTLTQEGIENELIEVNQKLDENNNLIKENTNKIGELSNKINENSQKHQEAVEKNKPLKVKEDLYNKLLTEIDNVKNGKSQDETIMQLVVFCQAKELVQEINKQEKIEKTQLEQQQEKEYKAKSEKTKNEAEFKEISDILDDKKTKLKYDKIAVVTMGVGFATITSLTSLTLLATTITLSILQKEIFKIADKFLPIIPSVLSALTLGSLGITAATGATAITTAVIDKKHKNKEIKELETIVKNVKTEIESNPNVAKDDKDKAYKKLDELTKTKSNSSSFTKIIAEEKLKERNNTPPMQS
jgi:hypothetical protein